MKKPGTFTFKKPFTITRRKGEVSMRYLDLPSELKSRILKMGYLAKDFVIEETITVRCVGARANVPYAERLKLQEQLDTSIKRIADTRGFNRMG